MRIRFFLFFVTILFFPPDLSAQISKKNYTLLWEISGNGITSPAYLFGSMHVRNKAAFVFPDSLFEMLTACDAFAAEVHFDSAMQLMLHKIVGKKELFSLAESLHDVNDICQKNDAEFAEVEIEKMPTYLDAYLMNFAKKAGKEIYGLENIEDQFALLKDNENNSTEDAYFSLLFPQTPGYKKMLDIYLSGDISKLDAFVLQQLDKSQLGNLLKRNQIQADKIERIILEKSLFCVVGAAHLPGENGVLNILKNKGFSLRPVTAKFSKNSKPKDIGTSLENWQLHEEKRAYYQFSTPAAKVSYKAPGSPFEMHLSADIGSGSFFHNTTFTKNSNNTPARIEEKFLQQIGGEVLSRKIIPGENWQAIELTLVQNSAQFIPNWRFRIITANNYIYIFQLGTFSPEGLHNEVADQYFSSFKILETPEPKWQQIQNNEGAFEAWFPDIPAEQKLVIEMADAPGKKSFDLNYFEVTDKETYTDYMIRYNDFPIDRIMQNDAVIFEELENNFIKKIQTNPVSRKAISLDNCPGKALRFVVGNQVTDINIYLRGNRVYILQAAGPQGKSNPDFFTKFKFTPFSNFEFTEFSIANNTATVLLANDTISRYFNYSNLGYTNLNNEHIYISRHQSGARFLCEVLQYSAFIAKNKLQEITQQLPEEFLETGDSIVLEKHFSHQQKHDAYKRTLLNPETQLVKIQQFIFNHSQVFIQTAFIADEQKNDKGLDLFFNSLVVKDSKLVSSLTPVQQLFLDLASTDKLVVQNAQKGMRLVKLQKTELPLVYKALERNYFDDQKNYGTKHLLLKFLENTTDEQTLSVLCKLAKKTVNENLRTTIFSLITQQKNTAAVDSFLQIFKQFPESNINYKSFLHLKDSLDLFRQHYSGFSNLAHHPEMMLLYFQWSAACFTQKKIPVNFIQNNLAQYEKLLDAAANLQEVFFLEDPDYLQAFVQFFNRFPFKQKYADALKKHYNPDRPNQNLAIVLYLVRQQQDVDPSWLEQLLSDNSRQLELLQQLDRFKQRKQIDQLYFDQAYIAKALLKKSSLHEFPEDNITFFKKRKLRYKGKMSTFYLFKLLQSSTGKDIYYLGLVGPFPKRKKQLVFNAEIIDWNYEAIKEDNIDELLSNILQWYKE